MHQIEPFYLWQHLYKAEEDEDSPFYGREYSEFIFTNKVYNFALHPQWDFIGSETLYVKLLYAFNIDGLAIIECIGEWNDCITNDIKILKEFLLDGLIDQGIENICLIGENILNFHGDNDCYYEELSNELENGQVYFLNFLPHVINEMEYFGLLNHVNTVVLSEKENWRKKTPSQLYESIHSKVQNSNKKFYI